MLLNIITIDKKYIMIDNRHYIYSERKYLRNKINNVMNNGHLYSLIESLNNRRKKNFIKGMEGDSEVKGKSRFRHLG